LAPNPKLSNDDQRQWRKVTVREYTPETITEAVIEQMSATPDARLKEIMDCAVRHVHAFAREVNLTPAEWLKGIEFLTKVGQMCTPARQEFILLSDTMGLSTLVNTLHDKTAREAATHTSLLGPFFREKTPRFEPGAQISTKDTTQEIVLWGRITDSRGRPLAQAQVTVWQTASDGRYDLQSDPSSTDCRGIFTSDAEGNYLIRSVRPLGYYIPLDGPVGTLVLSQKRHGKRPAHIHLLISAPGYRELVTALYLAGDEHLDDDVVFGAAADLVADVAPADPACPIQGLPSIHFDFSLSRQTDADKLGGRVGADPGQVMPAAEQAHSAWGRPPSRLA
jgi:protocatechuate 3,4-dioxygenase beta subunit